MLPQDHDGRIDRRRPARRSTNPNSRLAVAGAEPAPEDPAVFAARVRDAVLENLSARIDTELDARIAQAIHAEVETALAQLQGSLRAQLSEALKDVVGRAVDEEIARLVAVRCQRQRLTADPAADTPPPRTPCPACCTSRSSRSVTC